MKKSSSLRRTRNLSKKICRKTPKKWQSWPNTKPKTRSMQNSLSNSREWQISPLPQDLATYLLLQEWLLLLWILLWWAVCLLHLLPLLVLELNHKQYLIMFHLLQECQECHLQIIQEECHHQCKEAASCLLLVLGLLEQELYLHHLLCLLITYL